MHANMKKNQILSYVCIQMLTRNENTTEKKNRRGSALLLPFYHQF